MTLRHQGMVFHLSLGAKAPNSDAAVLHFLYGIQAGDAPQADDVAGLGEALLHLQHQGGAARHQAGIVAVIGQQAEGVVQKSVAW